MVKSIRLRIIGTIFLLSILLVFFIWYGHSTPNPEKGNFPNEKHIIEDYDSYIGEKVELGGEIVETKPLTIEVKSGSESIFLLIKGIDEPVNEGDHLTVYGLLENNNEIRVFNFIVQKRIKIIYMYGISSIAAVWVLSRLIKGWVFNIKHWTLEPRDEKISLKNLIIQFLKGEKNG